MYSVLSYGRMAADAQRIDAHARAVAKAVRPGDVVVDLGCGPGILSLLALRAGARLVHAIDTNPAVWLAGDLAAENGVADRLVLHHQSSFDVELEEPVDVIVADLRGSFSLFGQNFAAVEDARRRWLKPGGTLVPVRDRLFVALVESEAHWQRLELGWTSLERQGFQAKAARAATLNSDYNDDDFPLQPEQLVSDAKVWADLTYGTPAPRTVSATVDLSIERDAVVHALAIWFEATVHEDIVFDSRPGQKLVYRRVVLPLLAPVRVHAGDRASVTLRSDIGGEQWAWDTEIAGRARFRQASFLGVPTSPAALLRESSSATPARSSAGDRAARILAMLDGTRTLHEIAEALAAAEPDVRGETILDEVKSCARRYGR